MSENIINSSLNYEPLRTNPANFELQIPTPDGGIETIENPKVQNFDPQSYVSHSAYEENPEQSSWLNMGEQEFTADVSVDEKSRKVLNDIAEYHQKKQDDMKAQLFDRVYEQEQMAFFQEHKYFMGAKEKKFLAKEIHKLIDSGLLYVNQIGQIQRRGSNVTKKKATKKKRK